MFLYFIDRETRFILNDTLFSNRKVAAGEIKIIQLF